MQGFILLRRLKEERYKSIKKTVLIRFLFREPTVLCEPLLTLSRLKAQELIPESECECRFSE
jgi:hypothetical protein